MSKLDELIQQYCPNGVEKVELGKVCDYEQPTPYIVQSAVYDDAYSIPVLTAGQSFILGYTNEIDGVYKASKENPVIIFDDFTTSFHWVDFDFKVKSSAMKMIRPCNADANFRYIYYAMCCIKYEPTEHARHWISKYSTISIPLPPLPVQEEIVRILDAMTDLQENLEKELEERRRQYAFYRDKLLSFNELITPPHYKIEWKQLGEICKFKRGTTITAKNTIEGDVPVIAGGQTPSYYHNESNRPANTITCAGSGAYAGFISFWSVPIFVSDAFSIDPVGQINNRYLFHFLKSKQNIIFGFQKGAGVPHVHGSDLAKIATPLPPLSVQQEIVEKLDKMEELVSNIESELTERKKQYEYYREKLLLFAK